MASKNRGKSFMQQVEDHEREWGTKSYPGKPSLMQIMTAPVVAVWATDDKTPETLSLHDSLDEIERYFVREYLSRQSSNNKKRLAYIFQNKKRMIVAGFRVLFREAQE